MKLEYTNTYLSLKLKCVNRKLKNEPVYYLNKRKDKPVIRYYDNGKRHEIQSSSPRFKDVERVYLDTQNLRMIKKQLESVPGVNASVKIRTDIVPVISHDLYSRMIPKTDNSDGNHPYQHKQFYMRSRFEVAMAGVLDSLDLEYKYEPTIILNGYQVSPDFVVYLPEFDCCIIVECEGVTDEVSYVNRNGVKFAEYLYAGLVFGMTLVVLQGDRTHMPSPELMRNAVVSAINVLSSHYALGVD